MMVFANYYIYLNFQIEQKRKKLRKENRLAEIIPEDDPIKYKHAVYVMTMKVNLLCIYSVMMLFDCY